MRTPRALSSIATAGGAFTEPVPSSDVPCRPRAPPCRFQADRQLPPHTLLKTREVDFTRLARIVPPPAPVGKPRGRSPSLLTREDGGTTQDAFRRVALPAGLRTIEAALQPRRPSALRRRTGPSDVFHTFDGAEHDSHTVSLGRTLVRAPLRSSFLAGFPCETFAPPEARPLFRTHRRPCQRNDSSLRASSPSCGLPCGAPRRSNAICTTDFCYPLSRLRAPTYRELPASLRGLRLALRRRACTWRQGDRWTRRFTTPRPLRQARSGWRAASYSVRSRLNLPLAPLSRPALLPRAFARRVLTRIAKIAFPVSPVKVRRVLRPKVPSLVGGHSRTCVNRRQSRVRSREASATIWLSAAFSLTTPRVAHFTPHGVIAR